FPYNSFISFLPGFFNFQNTLYFSGNDAASGFELWKTDGTAGGTVLVKDINPGIDGLGNPNSSFPEIFLAAKNSSEFFFAATTDLNGKELWQSNGTGGSGTSLLYDVTGDA